MQVTGRVVGLNSHEAAHRADRNLEADAKRTVLEPASRRLLLFSFNQTAPCRALMEPVPLGEAFPTRYDGEDVAALHRAEPRSRRCQIGFLRSEFARKKGGSMSNEPRRAHRRSFFSTHKAVDRPDAPLPLGEVGDSRFQDMEPNQAHAVECPGVEGSSRIIARDESVRVGGVSFREVDEKGDALVNHRPKPLGILPVPAEVSTFIAKEKARLWNDKQVVPTPEALQRMADSFTLQYYYEGFDVAYRRASQGVEVLAVGHDDIGRLLSGMSNSARREIKVGQP